MARCFKAFAATMLAALILFLVTAYKTHRGSDRSQMTNASLSDVVNSLVLQLELQPSAADAVVRDTFVSIWRRHLNPQATSTPMSDEEYLSIYSQIPKRWNEPLLGPLPNAFTAEFTTRPLHHTRYPDWPAECFSTVTPAPRELRRRAPIDATTITEEVTEWVTVFAPPTATDDNASTTIFEITLTPTDDNASTTIFEITLTPQPTSIITTTQMVTVTDVVTTTLSPPPSTSSSSTLPVPTTMSPTSTLTVTVHTSTSSTPTSTHIPLCYDTVLNSPVPCTTTPSFFSTVDQSYPAASTVALSSPARRLHPPAAKIGSWTHLANVLLAVVMLCCFAGFFFQPLWALMFNDLWYNWMPFGYGA